MLSLKRGVVVDTDPLTVEVEGERRAAWADEPLVGAPQVGDDVIVNTVAQDLGLGSGGFDLIHVNLTRGLDAGTDAAHVMKLNYTSLQHPVAPVEEAEPQIQGTPPVLVLALHGQLAAAAWAAHEALPDSRVGYVQTAGGALPGKLSRTVAELRSRELLCDHITAGPSYGGEREAITTLGALHAAAGRGWDAAIAGPGPGILGSDTAYGHGGMAALDTAHAALALELPVIVCPRLSGADPRERHRGLSHHSAMVLGLLLRPVEIAAPTGFVPSELEALASERGHRLAAHEADLDGYRASGLPAETMGRSIDDDPDFFAAALAGGSALAAGIGRERS